MKQVVTSNYSNCEYVDVNALEKEANEVGDTEEESAHNHAYSAAKCVHKY